MEVKSRGIMVYPRIPPIPRRPRKVNILLSQRIEAEANSQTMCRVSHMWQCAWKRLSSTQKALWIHLPLLALVGVGGSPFDHLLNQDNDERPVSKGKSHNEIWWE